MKLSEKIKVWIEQLREKHKLTYMDDSTYHEKWSFTVSTLTIISVIIAYSLFLVIGVMLLVRYTSFSDFVNEQDNETQQKIEAQSRSIDSLYAITTANEKYLNDLKKLLNNEPFDDSTYLKKQDTTYVNYQPDFTRSKEDSILRAKMENAEKKGVRSDNGLVVDFFFPPVSGTISQSYNDSKSHYGVDVVTAPDEPVKACLDGTVIAAGWVPGEGNMIMIQHSNSFVSVYKHCSVLLRGQGDRIATGDPIGIVGNTGENSSGPHLHFELWHKGKPLNPQEFISF